MIEACKPAQKPLVATFNGGEYVTITLSNALRRDLRA